LFLFPKRLPLGRAAAHIGKRKEEREQEREDLQGLL
jgi:hypothetical protein